MELSDVKEYIDTIKDDSRFKELDEFTQMTKLQAHSDMYENIERYVKTYHSKKDDEIGFRVGNQGFEPDYDYFMDFLKKYMNNEPAQMPRREDGFIDLKNSLYLIQPGFFSKNRGNFLDHYIIMTDGSIYISKIALLYRGNSGIYEKNSLYSALIASYIAKSIQVTCAEIDLAVSTDGPKVISKNFLGKNEEIVSYTEDMELISEYLNQIDEVLRLRKFDESEIENTKFEFLKQEFVAKLIGLRDQKAENSPLIVGVDENENKHVRMAPMFDLDYSFHIGEDTKLWVRKCDNGKDDIASLIEQYKDYPGFEEFVKNSIKVLDMRKIFAQIYEDTKIEAFSNFDDNEQMTVFIEFVNENIEIAKQALSKVYKENERGLR